MLYFMVRYGLLHYLSRLTAVFIFIGKHTTTGLLTFVQRFILPIVLALCINPIVMAQSPYFATLGEQDGVIQRSVFCLLQDSTGFMWFGTRDGLLRYDGYSTVEYRHDPDRSDSLGNNSVFFLLKDRSGTIWVATEGGGLNRYVPETDTFVRYRHQDGNPNSLSVDELLCIAEDRNGVLWIGTNAGGLNRFDPATQSVTRFRHNPHDTNSLSNDTIWHLYHDRKGILWISTYGGGLDRFDPATETFTHFRHDPDDPTSLASNTVGAVEEDRNGILWVGGRGGLNRLDQGTGRFQRFKHEPGNPASLSYNHVWDIHSDSQGFLWLGTYGGGLNKFDPRTNKVVSRYTYESEALGSLGSNLIWQVIEDAGGIVWVATEGGGVTRFSRRAEAFGRHLKNPDTPFGLKHGIIASISSGRNNILWLANIEGGFQKMDRNTGEVVLYTHDPDTPNSLSHNNVMSILEDRDGMVWLGTYKGGLNRFDPITERFTHFRHEPGNPSSLSDDRVWSIAEDRKGNLWIGTLNGLNRLDVDRRLITRYRHNPADPGSISNNTIWTAYADRDGGIWIGTNNGLNYKASRQDDFVHYLHEVDSPNSLIHNAVMAIKEDASNTLWIGTDGGLSRLDRKSATFTNYTHKDGLVGDSVLGIVDDDQGNLWITTKRGLSKFNPVKRRFISYHQTDGLQDNEFLAGACAKTSQGDIVIGGTKGINLFNPREITDNMHLPPVVLTQFFRSGQPTVLGPALSVVKELALSYRDRVFGFEFAALDYANPPKNQYAYIMEGFDETWNAATSKERTVTYTTLTPGTYTFRVKASNNDGFWNEKGIAVQLTIAAPWWRSWVGWSLQVIAAGLFLWGLFFWRTRRMVRQHKRLEKKVSARTKALAIAKKAAETAREKAENANLAKSVFLANMSHELRTPMNAILGYSQLMRHDNTLSANQHNHLKVINSSGKHLMALINDVLELSKIEAKKVQLNISTVDLNTFFNDLQAMFRVKTEAKKLNFELAGIRALPRYVQCDENKLRQVLINLLNNAVKFTAHGTVQLCADAKVREGKEVLLNIAVTDTGVGIASAEHTKVFAYFEQTQSGLDSKKGVGLGLAISRHFVQMMGGEISLSSRQNQGSTFRFSIPVSLGRRCDIRGCDPQRRITGLVPGQVVPRILVAEDNPENRDLLVKLLEVAALNVVTAVDGQAAVEICSQWRPDFIWMDIRMPRLDGLQATQQIKAKFGDTAPVIVAITAHALEEEKERILAAGCDDLVRKPFQEEEIFAMMARHLGLRYIYETQRPNADEQPPEIELQLEELVDLPPELRRQLHQSALELNHHATLEVIDRIEKWNGSIAKILRTYALKYDYSAVLRLLEDGKFETAHK